METVYTERHRLRNAKSELFGGELVEPFERPERMDTILARLQSRKLGRIIKPREFGLAPVLRVHDPDYARSFEIVGSTGLRLAMRVRPFRPPGPRGA